MWIDYLRNEMRSKTRFNNWTENYSERIFMVEIKGKSFCFTGKFETKQKDSEELLTRSQVTELLEKEEGIVKNSVIKTLDYLVVGGLGSNLYSEGVKGKKILKAEQQPNTMILSEDEFFKAINY